MTPNYTLLYQDMLLNNYPEKLKSGVVTSFLQNSTKKAIDIININQFITLENQETNKKWQVYDKETILEIINYQNQNRLSNVATAKLYQISLVTLRKWKKHFLALELS